ncbi:Protein of unknown function [Pyronema omphalodes CBS 100304]|uniref:Uncharacterized protein n=1 Tax=Pyronema omphalodes (strain CBS 100304) TaxID=1076935 RepID=U4LHM9_PYROM|nr:Protein of unknown function [Pyronema omphalodes CBS 100304]
MILFVYNFSDAVRMQVVSLGFTRRAST